ncbi:response regulator [Streptomyces sp. NPDC087263]|uniref:response regulator n=1 Tax=Streptomyces sp. NPDC087263 TaxID=3365773 RepID=UPI0038260C47
MSMRCLLVDDSARFLEAARALLESDGVQVVGVASTGAEAVVRVRDLAPDVVLVDLDLDGESGFDLARRLAGDVAAVILISTHTLEDFQELVAASPARGFLHKSALSVGAIRELLGRED